MEQKVAVSQASLFADAIPMILPQVLVDVPEPSTPVLAEAAPVSDFALDEHAADPALSVTEAPDVPLGTYAVSVEPSGFRRLHRIGSCPRHPGVDYVVFELLGDVEPLPDSHSKRCKQCFTVAAVPQSSPESSSSEGSSSPYGSSLSLRL